MKEFKKNHYDYDCVFHSSDILVNYDIAPKSSEKNLGNVLSVFKSLLPLGVRCVDFAMNRNEREHEKKCRMEVDENRSRLKREEKELEQQYRYENRNKTQLDEPVSDISHNAVNCESFSLKPKTFNDILFANHGGEFIPIVGEPITAGGIYVIFGPTGYGKSALVTQMGIEAAEGKATELFPNSQACRPQKVIYLDSELNDDDITSRYGNYYYEFPEGLVRYEISFDTSEQFSDCLDQLVSNESGDSVVIVDNLTTICPALNGEKVKEFFRRLKITQLNARNRGVNLTVVLVGHTTKGCTNDSVGLKDLTGSYNLSAMATAVFSVKPVPDKLNLIEFEILKSRRKNSGASSFLLERVEEPYLHFRYYEEVLENDTQSLNDDSKVDSYDDVAEMVHMHEQGISLRDIGDEFKISHTTVSRKIKAFIETD